MRRDERCRRLIGACLVVGCTLAVPAAGWEIDGAATRGELEALHSELGSSLHLYPRHSAEPLGWTGFSIWADLGFQPDFPDAAITGSLPADGLAPVRVGARKGLPLGIDLGLAFGRAGELDLVDAELQWTLLRGNVARPGVAARLTAGRVRGSEVYEADRWSAELVVSKGIGPVTVFGSAGVVRSEADLRPAAGAPFSAEEHHEVLSAGASLDLLLPRVTFSVESGESVQAAVRVSVGF